MDRALEITKRLEDCAAANQMLLDKIRGLEAKAAAREQAVAESVRGQDEAAVELTRARGEMAVVRKEIDALRERVKRVEKDEVETLKMVIAALEKLLQQQDEP